MVLKCLFALKYAEVTLLSKLDCIGTALKILCPALLGIV